MIKEEKIIIRIDKETKEKLFEVAKQNDLSASHYLRRLINYAIRENLKL